MKPYFVAAFALSLGTGLGFTHSAYADDVHYAPANRVIEKTVYLESPRLKMKYQLQYGNNPALRRAYQTYLKTGSAPNIVTDGFVQFAYSNGSQPVVLASPLELTVITLEPGESVTNVSSGDPTRWSYSLAYSNQGAERQPHVMIKPSYPHLSTNVVITTDKRYYTLKLVSGDVGQNYTRNVQFWYPEEASAFWDKYNAEQAKEWNQTVAELPNLDVNSLHFNYAIKTGGFFTPSPLWKPIRVFDDGTHTYIQFPSTMNSSDMPALFIADGGNPELVNYRVKPPYFVVDKIFKQALLITGVGINQKKVVLTNHNRV